MEVFAIVIVLLLAVTGLIFLIGHGLGPSVKPTRNFDETPADVAVLDTSDGTPLNAEELDINIPRQMTPEEQEAVTKQFERLRVSIEAERRP